MDVDLFRECFAYVRDAYGLEKSSGPAAIHSPLSDNLLQEHLAGKKRIGCYTTDAAGMCNQLIIDLDIPLDKLDDAEEWTRTRDDAKRVAAAFDELGVTAFVTSSKSRGYHIRSLWEASPARDLRRLGQFIVTRVGLPPTEVFPKQDRRGKDGLGNFVWLPLHGESLKDGKTAICDEANGLAPLPDQWEALRDIRRNSHATLGFVTAVIEEWEKEHGPTLKAPGAPVEVTLGEGIRRDTLFSLAGTLRARGLGAEEILPTLREVNVKRCDPPVEDKHLVKMAQGVERYSPGKQLGADYHLSDLGNAKRLVATFGDRLKYCRPWKTWLVYDGTRWTRDDTGQVYRFAKTVSQNIYQEAAGEADDDRRKRVAAHALKTESEGRLEAMIGLARTEEGIAIRTEDLDRHDGKLNVLNGTLSLTDGKLYPHSPDDLISQLAPVSFDPEATFSLWMKFLGDIFLKREDLIRFVHRFFGYCATGSTKEQVFVIGHGDGGNGKTVLVETLSAVLGDYAQPAPFSTFTLKHNDNTRNDLAGLRNARLVTSSESTQGTRFNEELLKRITGDEKVTARFLYGEFFDYMPKYKLFLASNHLPKIKGTDYAIWRRVKLVPFEAVFTDELGNRDKDIKEKLLAEAPGILNWIVMGATAWHEKSLGDSEEIKTATRKYKANEDTLGKFLEECCEHDPELEQPARLLFVAYKEYCDGRAGNEKDFSQSMTKRGYEKRTTKKGALWAGLELMADRRNTRRGDG